MNKNLRLGYYFLPLLMFVAFFVMPHEAHAAETLYASVTDQGNADCVSSPQDSCLLKTALDTAFAADVDIIINIAAGTYTPDAQLAFTHAGFTHSLTLHGAGTDQTILEPANAIFGASPLSITTGGSLEIDSIRFTESPFNCLSITSTASINIHDNVFDVCTNYDLSVQHASGAGTASISDNTFLTAPGASDGGIFVNITSGADAFPVTLTGNTFNDNISTHRGGGAVYINSNSASAPILLNGNTFSDNETTSGSGGAVYINSTGANSGVTIGDGGEGHGNTFTNNTASASGGAVWIETNNSSSPVVLNGNTFDNNTATGNDGGGLYVATSGINSTVTLGDGGAGHGNTFTNNSANTAGGAFYLDTNGNGGTITIKGNTFGQAGSGNSVTNLGGVGKVFAGFGSTITGNTFTDNTAGGNVGGLALIVDGAGNTSDNLVESNIFTNNTAASSVGGLDINLNFNGGLIMNANKFTANTATGGEGGGARIQQLDSGEQIIVTNNLFAENVAGGESGGFDYYGGSSFGMVFTNNTVADNTAATKGGGVNFGFNNLGADYGIYNSIFWGNTAASGNDVHIDDSLFDAITFDNNDSSDLCFQSSGCDATPAVDFFAGNNITDNPEFADEDNGDYSLTELSPAVDAGDDTASNLPAKDITNGVTNRIQHTHVDMGAYELVIPAEDLDPYVLTETTPIASSLAYNNTSATYNFSITGSGQAEYVSTDCGNGSTLLFTDADTDPGHQAVVIQGLASDRTYTCSFHIHSIAGDSNTLTIGPFSVQTIPGAVPVQFLIDLVRATAHPDGTLVLSEGTVYLIKNGQRFGFRDPAEYQSYGYNFNQVVPANDSDMRLGFDSQNILKAMPGTLVLDKTDGKTVYMIGSNYTKRGFTSAVVFKNLGYTFKNLPKIDLSDYPTGPVIDSEADAHPEGALVLDGKTVWWILNNTKQGFESQTVFDTYGFSFARVVKANSADVELPTGNLIPLRDGTIVFDTGNYYIISDGTKHQFATTDTLAAWGYKASNAVNTSLANYAAGQMIN